MTPRKGATKRVTWQEVARVLPDDETRSYALGRFRDAGFAADSFKARIEVRATVMRGLTTAEDWLEMRYPKRDRTAIRDVRRRLELEPEGVE